MAPSPLPRTGWYLEGFLDGSGRRVRAPIQDWPFRIGRAHDQHLHLPAEDVSGRHARLDYLDGRVVIEDLDSTNGTWVNRKRIHGSIAVGAGDVLHFAGTEVILLWQDPLGDDDRTITRSVERATLSRHYHPHMKAFQAMIAERRLSVAYQPIVDLQAPSPVAHRRRVVAWEGLGRGDTPGLPRDPGALFDIAATVSAESELSRAMREVVVGACDALPGPERTLFVNMHPAETEHPALLGSLAALNQAHPDLHLVLELHERAVRDLDQIRDLAAALDELGVSLAYDDFGAGEARLVELVEVPPAYLKFDRVLVAGLPDASPQKRRLVQTLVDMVRELGITALAEGVEREEEAVLCAELGFQLGQGWFFGRPLPPRELSDLSRF